MRVTRNDWLPLATDLDWDLTAADERELFPEAVSGAPWLPLAAWSAWEEPFKTTFRSYVRTQSQKNEAVFAVRASTEGGDGATRQARPWLNGLKLHAATLPLAEFAAVIGNLRATRFARTTAWRNAALLAALDETRHAQIPLLLMHDLVRHDAQFDWTHKLYHTDNWVAMAARRLVDELLVASDPIEFAVATNFVFETGFTNLQFIGLASLAKGAGDKMLETMLKSIQTDEARHAQIGPAVLAVLVRHDPERAQRLIDKWFWRTWQLFAVVTGFAMDYLTPVEQRRRSFKEFVEEWVIGQFSESLDRFGLHKPWYWEQFLASVDTYHHMVYATAYSYRATVWLDFVLPGPKEREWLAAKYPNSWSELDPIWERIASRWRGCDPGLDMGVHGTAIPTFCHLCQLVLCHGRPSRNAAVTAEHAGEPFIFCSEPCRHLFLAEPHRYAANKDIVKRVLAGEMPGNVIELIHKCFDLRFEDWGKDAFGGVYDWLERTPREAEC